MKTVALLLGLFLAGSAAAQDSLGIQKIGEITYLAGAYNVAISGSYAYLTDPAIGLFVLENSDPENPTFVTYTPLLGARGICIQNNTAIIVGAGLTVVSLAQPETPEILGHCGGWDGLQVAVQNNYAYVGSYFSGFLVVDIFDPYNPEVVAQLGVQAKSIAITGNYAYLAGGGGFQIADISQPENPILVGYYPCYAQGVDVQGSFAYVGVSNTGLTVFDVSNPAHPTVHSFLSGIVWINNIAISGNHAYISGSSDGGDSCGFWIFDISDPGAVRLVGLVPFYGVFPMDVTISGNLCYLPLFLRGMPIYDVSVPENPVEVGGYNQYGAPQDVALYSHYIILATAGGLRIVDVQNPSAPQEIGWLESPLFTTDYLAVSGNYAYVSCQGLNNLLKVVDISNPTTPSMIGQDSITAYFLWASGNIVYANNLEDLQVVDVSNPSQPTIVGHYLLPASSMVYSMALDGTTGYCACGSAGFRIVDFSDPTNPIEIGQLDLPGQESVVAQNEDLAYIGSVYGGLSVVDIADPASPVVIGHIDMDYCLPMDISYADDHIIIADSYTANYDRLRVFDVTNPLSLQEVGYYNIGPTSSWWLRAFAASGGYAYVAVGQFLSIYNCSEALSVNPWKTNPSYPSSFSFQPCSPNPFNPTTSLTYELPVATDVKLTVWNTAGQLVATLVNERRLPGTHSVTFDGSGLPSGVYIAKLIAGESTAAKKLVLMK